MRILAITFKDLLRSIRSFFFIGMAVIVPLVITGLIFLAFGGNSSGTPSMQPIRLGIVNHDEAIVNGPTEFSTGQILTEVFSDSINKELFTLTPFNDENLLREAVKSQKLDVAVIIPSGFTTDLMQGIAPEKLVLIQDPTLTIQPMIVSTVIQQVLDGFSGGMITIQTIAERSALNGIQLTIDDYATLGSSYASIVQLSQGTTLVQLTLPESAPETEKNPMSVILASICAGMMVFFSFYTGGYSMMTILQEEEEGTLARIFTSTLSRSSVLMGKLLSVFLMVLLQGVIMLVLGSLLFKVQWGQLLSVGMALLGQVMAASGLGVLLISLVRNSRQAGPVLGGGLSVLGMLGGLFTLGIPNQPAFLITTSKFLPQGWVMQAWKLALAGNPPVDLLPALVVCTILGVVMTIAGALIFNKRIA